jgi:hypothetical protein
VLDNHASNSGDFSDAQGVSTSKPQLLNLKQDIFTTPRQQYQPTTYHKSVSIDHNSSFTIAKYEF